MKRPLFGLLALVALAGLTGCAHHQGCCAPSDCNVADVLPDACADCAETYDACDPANACRACDESPAPDLGGRLRSRLLRRRDRTGTPGPAVGAITYPYYTLRGPRDFLARSPRPIGP